MLNWNEALAWSVYQRPELFFLLPVFFAPAFFAGAFFAGAFFIGALFFLEDFLLDEDEDEAERAEPLLDFELDLAALGLPALFLAAGLEEAFFAGAFLAAFLAAGFLALPADRPLSP